MLGSIDPQAARPVLDAPLAARLVLGALLVRWHLKRPWTSPSVMDPLVSKISEAIGRALWDSRVLAKSYQRPARAAELHFFELCIGI